VRRINSFSSGREGEANQPLAMVLDEEAHDFGSVVRV
jgi:hypothetical protein